MAKVTVTVCDECRKTGRLVEIGHAMYCSRDCYLAACKRLFNSEMDTMLKSAQPVAFRKPKPRASNVA